MRSVQCITFYISVCGVIYWIYYQIYSPPSSSSYCYDYCLSYLLKHKPNLIFIHNPEKVSVRMSWRREITLIMILSLELQKVKQLACSVRSCSIMMKYIMRSTITVETNLAINRIVLMRLLYSLKYEQKLQQRLQLDQIYHWSYYLNQNRVVSLSLLLFLSTAIIMLSRVSSGRDQNTGWRGKYTFWRFTYIPLKEDTSICKISYQNIYMNYQMCGYQFFAYALSYILSCFALQAFRFSYTFGFYSFLISFSLPAAQSSTFFRMAITLSILHIYPQKVFLTYLCLLIHSLILSFVNAANIAVIYCCSIQYYLYKLLSSLTYLGRDQSFSPTSYSLLIWSLSMSFFIQLSYLSILIRFCFITIHKYLGWHLLRYYQYIYVLLPQKLLKLNQIPLVQIQVSWWRGSYYPYATKLNFLCYMFYLFSKKPAKQEISSKKVYFRRAI